MPRIKAINMRSLFQYKAALVTLTFREIDNATETLISETIQGPIKFISGYKPDVVQNNCAFLEMYQLPSSVTAKGYAFFNVILPVGTHNFGVKKNQTLVDSFAITVVSGNICSKFLKLENYNATMGDVIEVVMPSNPLLSKKFIVLPDGNFSNYIAFEDEYRLRTTMEFKGDYSFPIEYEMRTNKVQKGVVFNTQKVSSEKTTSLIINTGFVLQQEEITIESLFDSLKAWLIIGENKGIELVPIGKKLVGKDPKRAYYEYDIEFRLNLESKKPLLLNLNAPLQIVESDDIPPSQPTNLAASKTTTTSTNLEWTPSIDVSGIAGYDVFMNGVFLASSVAPTFVVTNLSISTTYAFYVIAKDIYGNRSIASNTVNVTTAAFVDITPPSQIQNVVASMITPTSMRITWDPSIDNVGVSIYRIFLNGVGITTGTYHNFTGLTPGTTYSIYVVAGDAAGNLSIPSATITPTTLAQLLQGFIMSFIGMPLINDACSIFDRLHVRYHEGTSVWPSVGDIIYEDSSGLTPFIGDRLIYPLGNNNWIQIDEFGVVISQGSC
jgi:chitodextrinase